MALSNRDLKLLWAKSGGFCAFPGCNQELIGITNDDIFGHTCHIIAQSPDGPRGDISVDRNKIDSERNILLLCPNHHREIDTNVDLYTVEKLQEMKGQHEKNIKMRLHTGEKSTNDLAQLYYINLPRVAILAAYNSIDIDYSFMEGVNCLYDLGFDLGYVVMHIKQLVHDILIHAINLEANCPELFVGNTIKFTRKFRTKGMPAPNKVSDGSFKLKGNIKNDPQIYSSQNERKLILALDPRWVTTTTSFCQFVRGWIDVTGLAIIKEVDDNNIIASPYVLGIPKTPWDRLLRTAE